MYSEPPGGSLWADTIGDCGFPIGFFRYGLIGDRQSQIGNRMSAPTDSKKVSDAKQAAAQQRLDCAQARPAAGRRRDVFSISPNQAESVLRYRLL